MKKIQQISSALKVSAALWCAAGPLAADQSGNFTYTDNGTSITITDYPTSATGPVVIPATIAGKPVTAIGNLAFAGCSGMTSVSIPVGVTAIGDYAFLWCGGLTELTIPSTVTSIGWEAFSRCGNLTDLTLCPGVATIGTEAFAFCTDLSTVTLPASVTTIGDYAFAGCGALARANFLGNAPTIGANVFSGAANGFTIQYLSNRTGFSIPGWQGYSCVSYTEFSFVWIGKQLQYVQSSAAAPQADPQEPYSLGSGVARTSGVTTALLSSSTLTPPPGCMGTACYCPGSDGLGLSARFTTKAALDAAYGTGTYIATIQTSSPNTYSAAIPLGADNYPAVPQITGVTNATWNGGALVISDYTKDVTITWNNPNGANTWFQVGGTNVTSPGNTPATSLTIPGRSLQNNSAFQASIQLSNTSWSGSPVSGVPGIGASAFYQVTVQFFILTGTGSAAESPAEYLLLKNHVLQQTSNNAPADLPSTSGNGDPAPFSLTCHTPLAGTVSGPASTSLPLTFCVGSNLTYRFSSGGVGSLANLNSAYPNGSYTFPGGASVNLTGDAYPAAAQVISVNGTTPVWDAQGELVLDPAIDNTIAWSPVTVSDFATMGHESIEFSNDNDWNFNTIEIEAGVLGSSSTPVTSFTVAKGTMTPTYTYTGTVSYVSASTVSNPPSNVYDIAGYQTETQFTAVALKPQTITFGTVATQQFPGSPVVPVATADSGLPVSVSVLSGPAMMSGGVVVLTGTGTVTLRACQAGNGIYASAAVTQGFNVTATSVLNVTYDSASLVPLAVTSYNPTGCAVDLSLNFAPTPGTILFLIQNNGSGFISGTFSNLAQGQVVPMTYGGVTYNFVANYYGGRGRDLVLQWANVRPVAWGNNSNGQVGDNSTTNRLVPVNVTTSGALSNKIPLAAAGGGNHTLVLCSDGTLVTFGFNSNGQLGNNSTTDSWVPVPVNTVGVLAGKTVVAISAGGKHSLALCSDGTVAAWGNNPEGRLGNNGTSQSSVPVAVYTAGALSGKTVVAISAGNKHSLALCSDGTLVAWGSNTNGRLGNNSTTDISVPVAINSFGVLAGKTVVAVAGGNSHSLALCSDGTVAAWGANANGQLGNNSTSDSWVPVAVNTAGILSNKNVAAIAAGGTHNLAFCSDGTVVAWGANGNGQLGINSTADSPVPVAPDTSGVIGGRSLCGIAAGGGHSIALSLDGTIPTWGWNSSGQLGVNSTSNCLTPVAINTGGLASGEVLMGAASGSSAAHTLGLVASPQQDVSFCGVGKTITYDQASASAPTLDPEQAYTFNAWVQAGATGHPLASSSLTPPAGSTGTLAFVAGSNGLEGRVDFLSKAALDADFAAGTYDFAIQAATAQTGTISTYSTQISLGTDNYPAVPRITGVTNATWQNGCLHITDYTKDVTITWNNPASTMAQFQVNNTNVNSSNNYTGNTWTISGGTLQNNTIYSAYVQLANGAGGSSSIPGAQITFNYQTQVEFVIATGSPDTSSSPTMYLLRKDHVLLQTSNNPPVDGAGNQEYLDFAPYSLTAECPVAGTVTGPANLPLSLAGGQDNGVSYHCLSGSVASLSALNAGYPNGSYTFPGGASVSLTGDGYPAAPQVLTVNGGTPAWDAQGRLILDPTVANTIVWSTAAISNFSTSAHESVEFRSDGDNSFNSIDIEAGALSGNPTQVTTMTLPASSMTSTYTYTGQIRYFAVSSYSNPSTNIYDIAGYETVTCFLVVAMKPQTITFGAISNKPYPGSPFTLGATASSGLPVSYSVVSGPATILGNTVTLTGAGTVTIQASQPGSATYASAANVTQGFSSGSTSLLATFRTTYGLAADGSQDLLTPANDKVPNLLKFAFNMMGTGQGQAAALTTPNCRQVGATGTAGLPSSGVNGGKLMVTYLRRKAATSPGVSYAVLFSNDLTSGSWAMNPAATESVTSIDSNFERVTVTDSVTASPRFARVRVTAP